jgi:hypothetical protein
MLGKDCDRNEYWFFKEETGKLFVKKFDNPTPKPIDVMQIDEEGKVKKEENNLDVNDIIELKQPSF